MSVFDKGGPDEARDVRWSWARQGACVREVAGMTVEKVHVYDCPSECGELHHQKLAQPMSGWILDCDGFPDDYIGANDQYFFPNNSVRVGYKLTTDQDPVMTFPCGSWSQRSRLRTIEMFHCTGCGDLWDLYEEDECYDCEGEDLEDYTDDELGEAISGLIKLVFLQEDPHAAMTRVTKSLLGA